MIGSLLGGKLLDLVSRKNAFLLTDVLAIIATGLSQVTNIYVFIISRLLSGAATGLNSTLVPSFIQETAPT